MSTDKHHQRVVLDTIRRRIDSLNEIQALLDTAAEALGQAAMLSESGCRPNTPDPLRLALMELLRLSQAARLECLQVTHNQQRNYADQVVVVADQSRSAATGAPPSQGAHVVLDDKGHIFVLGSSAEGKSSI